MLVYRIDLDAEMLQNLLLMDGRNILQHFGKVEEKNHYIYINSDQKDFTILTRIGR